LGIVVDGAGWSKRTPRLILFVNALDEYSRELRGIRNSLVIQGRVLNALLMREIITRYGRNNIGFLWLFVEPMLFTLAITLIWSITRSAHGMQIPIVAFALTGYSSMMLWRNSSNRCLQALQPNQALMYHRNVRALDVLLARIFLEVSASTASCFFLSVLFIAVGWMEIPSNLSQAMAAWMLLTWFALSLGMFIGALSERSELVSRMWRVLVYLLFPLSGAGFLVDWMPTSFQKLLMWVPMINGLEMFRAGYFGAAQRFYYDTGYLILVNLLLLTAGMALLRGAEDRVQSE
jgi:capsular polysaccharide transport system permease protein